MTKTILLGSEKTSYDLLLEKPEDMSARFDAVMDVLRYLNTIFDDIRNGKEFYWREEAEDEIIDSLWWCSTCESDEFVGYVTHELIERTVDDAYTKEESFETCLLPRVLNLLFLSPKLL